MLVFFVKPKTAYELRISDWSSDVCSSDLVSDPHAGCMVLFRADEDGCQPFGTASIPVTTEPHTLLMLASLVIPLGTTPEQAFQLAEREIRRLTNHQRN